MCVCVDRLQHEASVLQQQLCESRSLACSLQCELQVYHRVCGVNTNTHSGKTHQHTGVSCCFYLQISDKLGLHPGEKKKKKKVLNAGLLFVV